MRRIFLTVTLAFLASSSFVSAQDKPAIVVHTFTATPGQPWPYDMKPMATQTVADLQRKDGKRFDVAAEAPAGRSKTYTLDGEVTEWHPGNRAKRLVVGMGSAAKRPKFTTGSPTQAARKSSITPTPSAPLFGETVMPIPWVS